MVSACGPAAPWAGRTGCTVSSTSTCCPTASKAWPAATLFIERPGANEPQPVELARAGGTDRRPLVTLAGVDSREAATALHGAVVLASGTGLDEGVDHYPVSDLLGARAVTGDRELGVVTEVLMNPAHDILQIDAPDGTRTLVPFVAELVEVDRERRLLTVREGLL